MAEDAGDGEIRVGDTERQAIVDRLSSATGDGLLTLDEFADAAGAAYAAVTRAQLDEVLRPLRLPAPSVGGTPAAPVRPEVVTPAPATTAAPDPAAGPVDRRQWVVAVMSGEDRKGRWKVRRRTGAFALMGGVVLDLRGAVVDDAEVEITAWAVMGNVTVIVPEGIAVESSGFVLMGGRSNKLKDAPPVPGAPVVRVRGYGIWGSVDVKSRGDREDRARERHDRHAARHGRGPGPAPPPLPTLPVPPTLLGDGDRAEASSPTPAPSTAPAPVTPGGLVAVVATDIVGSTRWADTLGDQRWRALLGEHNALVRRHLGDHGGQEIKQTGDGFVLAFTSPRAAVRFALDVQDAMATHRDEHPATPVEVRIGVHAGEVERDGADLVGRNVTIACRLCDRAAPGTVLASALVADLADSASDIAFGEPVAHDVTGLDRQVTARVATRR